MLKNYFKIAVRNLARARGYAAINIAGLGVGMAASALIFLWVQSELNFDRFYSKSSRLFQVYNRDQFNGVAQAWETTPLLLGPTLKRNFADIEDVSRFSGTEFLLSANEKNVDAGGAFADAAFLKLFDFKIIAGNRGKALSGNNGILVTKSLAEKLFGTTDVLGKIVEIGHQDNFSVTAVLDDIPDNSKFHHVTYLLPWAYHTSLGRDSEDWSSNNFYTYVLLNEKADTGAVNTKIKGATVAHLKGILDDVSHREIFLHPAEKWHLYSREKNGQLVDGKIVTVRLFAIIAILIVLIAAVNFINLSTARSEKRAKEVGVRKVAGANRAALIFQFISESVLLAFLSGMVALVLVIACIPTFNVLTDKQLYIDFTAVDFWFSAIAFVLITGLLAGSVPAFFLSGFQPLKVIKGTYKPIRATFSPRKVLVVFQFTFAIVLIISTLVIRQQINHAQSRESGFNSSNLVFTSLTGDLNKHYTLLEQELISSGAAISISKSLGPITEITTRQWGVQWPGSTQAGKNIEFDRFAADADFTKTMGTRLLAGREINVHEYPTDSNALILNETAVKSMHLKDPLNAHVKFHGREWHVIGVMKDFIFGSPYDPVNPALIHGPCSSLSLNWMSMRLNPQNATAQNLETVEAIFKKYNPGYPFEYAFADESYNAKFADEKRTASLTAIFTGLTIFISCLGLFGLAAYTAEQRTKEIGVRKVLGATVASIIGLLTREFIVLMWIALLVAAPVGWYAMEKWLQDFTYRISISVGTFIITSLFALIIVILTVSFQAVKAALMNPVKSLKSE